MPVITTIQRPLPSVKKRKRVAAYARVSMECEQLLHSLSAQVSYYSSLIQRNPEWEYAGVYIDEGITGTSKANRDDFNRLIADCDAGKIDIILVKSISRFARMRSIFPASQSAIKRLNSSLCFVLVPVMPSSM